MIEEPLNVASEPFVIEKNPVSHIYLLDIIWKLQIPPGNGSD